EIERVGQHPEQAICRLDAAHPFRRELLAELRDEILADLFPAPERRVGRALEAEPRRPLHRRLETVHEVSQAGIALRPDRLPPARPRERDGDGSGGEGAAHAIPIALRYQA